MVNAKPLSWTSGLLRCAPWIAVASCNAGVTDLGRFGSATSDASTSSSTTSVDASTSSSSSSSSTEPDTTGDGPKLDVGHSADESGTDTESGSASCKNIDEFEGTSVGCEFWAVQVPSEPPFPADNLPFGISVGNPTPYPATISILDRRGAGGSSRVIETFELAPGENILTAVNGDGGVLEGEQHDVAELGLTPNAAFRVVSDVPITAMQIYPVGGADSHVSEASLLLPTNTLGTTHIAVGYPAIETAAGPEPGFIIVVGTENATTITTADGDVMIDAFDAWTFQNDGDATGFFLSADKPVSVFSGSSCSFIPGNSYACDHLEEQVVPLATWGNEYVAPPHPPRVPELNPYTSPELVYWRVVAGQADTTITLEPPVAMGGEIHLASTGDFAQFTTAEGFIARSDNPFMLVQFMSSCLNVVEEAINDVGPCYYGDGVATGDPWMIQVTPVEQWLTSLPFLTDTSYPRDFVMLMREAGTAIEIECLGTVSDDHFVAIPNTKYEVGWVDLDIAGKGGEGSCVDGTQFLTADAPVGVLVGGIDWATAYGYPGGMRLGTLWDPPTQPPG